MSILTINNLSKAFGTNTVIDNMSLAVPENSIFGFIGQNGSGKTTTMKMILGLLEADSGAITVCDETIRYGKTNPHIGYLPDVPEFYNYMRPMEYLSLCGQISNISSADTKSRSLELLSLVGLDGAKKKIGGFSRGMKQRLGIAQALLTQPKLLICDEPTSALDPIGRKEILEILEKVKGSTTVVFSTHILSDVERICDHVAVLHNGNIAVSGTLLELKALHKKDRFLLEFAEKSDLEKFQKHTLMQPLLSHSESKDNEIILEKVDVTEDGHTIIAALANLELCPIKMELIEPTLENLYLEVVQ